MKSRRHVPAPCEWPHERLFAEFRFRPDLRRAARSCTSNNPPTAFRAKLGTKAAVTAAAHKLARILYAMVKHRTPFEPALLGNPEQSRARKERFLRRQAEQLGFTVTPVEQKFSSEFFGSRAPLPEKEPDRKEFSDQIRIEISAPKPRCR